MKKRHPFSVLIFVLYSAVLIKVMVFKDVPTIRIGHLMFNFKGADAGRANFVPLKTILSYLHGNQGLIIAGVNLAGNIALLVPIGFLVALIIQNVTWKKLLALAVAAGLSIEILQVLFHVGIFDIDDVLLNGLGVITGYGVFVVFAKWTHAKAYKRIIVSIAVVALTPVAIVYAIYPKHDVAQGALSKGDALCGNTPGTGQIISQKDHMLLLKRNDGVEQAIKLTDHTTIKTSAGTIASSNLKAGDRVTVVIEDTTTATTVLVCKPSVQKSGTER